jgi:hypothetical protein
MEFGYHVLSVLSEVFGDVVFVSGEIKNEREKNIIAEI